MAKNRSSKPPAIPQNFAGNIYTGVNIYQSNRVQKPQNKKTTKKAKKMADTPGGNPQKIEESYLPRPPDPSAAATALIAAAAALSAALAPAPPPSSTKPPSDKGSDDPSKDTRMGDEGEDAVSAKKARNRAKKALQKERKERGKQERERERELNDLKRYKADNEKLLAKS